MYKLITASIMNLLLACSSSLASAADATAFYMANEGLMVTEGDTKILFDPLFRDSYGQYLLLPPALETALFNGAAPFDGVDAVFVSHYHGDHFSAADILRLLKQQPGIHLYAPNQAVVALRAAATQQDAAIFSRVSAVDLAYMDTPVSLQMPDLLVEAVRIPHSGWPTGRLDVENIAWRVTLNATTTVLHLGDADPNDVHFARDAAYWDRTRTHMAFPPYWFFGSASGEQILRDRIKPVRSVGIHVPVTIPGDPIQRPTELRRHDLFTQPGESRVINIE